MCRESDSSLQGGGTLYVGEREGLIDHDEESDELMDNLPTESFAGIVCVAD